MDLHDRVALVTGASSGIGRATARLFAKHGARVALAARSEDELNALADEIRADGGEALVVPTDVSKPDEVEASIQKIDDEWGRLDVVFANAGINGVWAPIDELEPDEWNKTIAVNLTGTYHTIHFAVPLMKREDGGAILITASINGTRRFTGAGATAYASTKAAQLAMGNMLALELAKHRIRVNVICPGAIDTAIEEKMETRDEEEAAEPVEYPAGDVPLTDGTPGTPNDVADLALFLASDRARHITGTPIWIDGAESLLQG
jgi:NAD(P)-dependent dehydrogenase (short-subunit alcohol dehydrogenase family)